MKFNFELSVRRALPTCGELQASFAVFFTYAGCDSPSLPDWRVHMRPVPSATQASVAHVDIVFDQTTSRATGTNGPQRSLRGPFSCPLVTDLGTLVLLII
jgi:hypothetical protein